MTGLYTKPYVDPATAVKALISRGMAVPDVDRAINLLSNVGYYRLSGYWYPQRQLSSDSSRRLDVFATGSNFDHVIEFYEFDRELRLILLDALERIEVSIRSIIVEVLGSKHPLAYRNSISYNSEMNSRPPRANKTRLELFVDGCDRQFRTSKEDFAKHFSQNYISHPPIWIAAGTWDWGKISHIYRGLRDKHRKAIALRIDKKLRVATLDSWLRSLNDVRNACAHHARVWNRSFVNHPTFQGVSDSVEFVHMWDGSGEFDVRRAKRLYGHIVTMKFLTDRLHPNTAWERRLFDHVETGMVVLDQVHLHAAGFPQKWDAQELGIPRSA